MMVRLQHRQVLALQLKQLLAQLDVFLQQRLLVMQQPSSKEAQRIWVSFLQCLHCAQLPSFQGICRNSPLPLFLTPRQRTYCCCSMLFIQHMCLEHDDCCEKLDVAVSY